MNFNEYQKQARTTRLEVPTIPYHVYLALGLVNEAGEVVGKIKKLHRDDDGKLSDERREVLKKELGDVLWYLSQLAADLDLSLQEIAEHNIEKLFSRKERGVLTGDGDKR